MKKEVIEWRKNGKHLPDFMRDFHDQKDLFKALYQIIDVEKHEMAGHIKWVEGHCYVVDVFLWFMAKYGYTLQKNRTKLDFEDIYKAIGKTRDERNVSFNKLLKTEKP